MSYGYMRPRQGPVYIRDVWADNLEQEMLNIRSAISQYPFVAMDTEFPGVVARPMGAFKTASEWSYQNIRANVDLLQVIQIGITLVNENGEFPSIDGVASICTWQFNMKFSTLQDMYAPDSIDLLSKTGMDFAQHEQKGIDHSDFGELLISSGLVLDPDVHWVSFHSGYDFGYLIKALTGDKLPQTYTAFFELMEIWFPSIWDIKYMMKACKTLKGGLQEVADDLQVKRVGPQHQAGSDSLLTASTFFRLKSQFFNDTLDSKYKNILFGLNHSVEFATLTQPRERNGATHYPIPEVDPTKTPSPPRAPAPSAAIAIRSPSPTRNRTPTKITITAR